MSVDPVDSKEPEGSFDQILERLRVVVDRLEGDELTLEQSLATFEEGVRLSRRGSSLLDAAERRVELLLRDEDGAPRLEPMAAGPEGGDPALDARPSRK